MAADRRAYSGRRRRRPERARPVTVNPQTLALTPEPRPEPSTPAPAHSYRDDCRAFTLPRTGAPARVRLLLAVLAAAG